MRTASKRLAAIAVTLPSLLLVANPANAATFARPGAAHPMMCPPGTSTQIDKHWSTFVKQAGQLWTGGPGGTLSVTSTKSTQLQSTKSGSATVKIDEILADTSVTLGYSVSKSVTTSIGATYSHPIPNGKKGTIAYGSWAIGVDWSSWREGGNCKATKTGSGSATLLTSPGFEYWTD